MFLERKLNEGNLLFREVVLEIETKKLILLVLQLLVEHGEDAVDGAPLIGVDCLDPRVAVGVELVDLCHPLAVVQVLEARQTHHGRRACTHGGRGEEMKRGERSGRRDGGVFCTDSATAQEQRGTAENLLEEEEVGGI